MHGVVIAKVTEEDEVHARLYKITNSDSYLTPLHQMTSVVWNEIQQLMVQICFDSFQYNGCERAVDKLNLNIKYIIEQLTMNKYF